ncbi:MAG: aromatic-ring-hydroxylating dioxygenase subunit beta [Pseudomonadota bacterium]
MTAQAFETDAVERFIKAELRHLNAHDFAPWIDLFTDDGVYFMPLDEAQCDPSTYDMIMYDTKALMRIRLENFGHPKSPSMEYPIRSMRMMSDCQIISQNGDTCRTQTPFMASIFYQEMNWYCGTYYHDFVRDAGAMKIKRKQVNLLNMGAPMGAIMTYL